MQPAPAAVADLDPGLTDPLGLERRLLYRDGLVLVIDKPAGIPVHAGPKGGVNLEDGFDALRFGLPGAPALAHRLDRDTSGCLALGRHRKALARLGRLFAAGAVGKTYWAVVRGRPAAEAGRIEAPLLKRSTEARGWWMKVDPAGKPAVTEWRLLGSDGAVSFLELRPLTGRTHQIRVHCEALGCPVVGDPIYGREIGPPPEPAPSLLLHARSLVLPLYERRPAIEVTAPVPPHLEAALRRCGWSGEAPAGAGLEEPPAEEALPG